MVAPAFAVQTSRRKRRLRDAKAERSDTENSSEPSERRAKRHAPQAAQHEDHAEDHDADQECQAEDAPESAEDMSESELAALEDAAMEAVLGGAGSYRGSLDAVKKEQQPAEAARYGQDDPYQPEGHADGAKYEDGAEHEDQDDEELDPEEEQEDDAEDAE